MLYNVIYVYQVSSYPIVNPHLIDAEKKKQSIFHRQAIPSPSLGAPVLRELASACRGSPSP